MQLPEWEDNDTIESVEQQPVAESVAKPSAHDKVHILELRRRLEERLDSKRIEMEYGSDYLNDESIQ